MRRLSKTKTVYLSCQFSAPLRALFVAGLILFSHAAQASFVTRCFDSFQKLETKIMGQLSQKTFAHAKPRETSLQAVREHVQANIETLRKLGVDFEGLDAQELRDRRLETTLKFMSDQRRLTVTGSEGVDLAQVTTLYRLKSVPPSSHEYALGSAITHKDFPNLLKRIEALNHDLLLDPTMSLTSMGGYQQNGTKGKRPLIVINPRTPYHTLVHEIDHAEFDRNDVENFVYRAAEILSRGGSEQHLQALIARPSHIGYGEARLRRVIELLRSGFPEDKRAVAEAMAVDSQIRALESSKETSTSNPVDIAKWIESSRNYSKRHTLDALVSYSIKYYPNVQLSKERRILLLECLDSLGVTTSPEFKDTELPNLVARYKEKHAPPSMAREKRIAVAGVSAVAATVIGVVFHKEIGALVLYLSNGDQIVIGPDDDDAKKKKKE